MQAIVVQRKIHGLEVWQVYTKHGLASQHWSREYADAAAERYKRAVKAEKKELIRFITAELCDTERGK